VDSQIVGVDLALKPVRKVKGRYVIVRGNGSSIPLDSNDPAGLINEFLGGANKNLARAFRWHEEPDPGREGAEDGTSPRRPYVWKPEVIGNSLSKLRAWAREHEDSLGVEAEIEEVETGDSGSRWCGFLDGEWADAYADPDGGIRIDKRKGGRSLRYSPKLRGRLRGRRFITDPKGKIKRVLPGRLVTLRTKAVGKYVGEIRKVEKMRKFCRSAARRRLLIYVHQW
jgi:hypothetical protein